MDYQEFPDSSNIDAISHSETTLKVKFRHSGEYEYLDVPRSVFLQACNAPSIGTFIATNVKNKYKHRKL